MEEPTIGNVVFTMRKYRGLTQEELAVASSTSRECISQIENDRMDVDGNTLFNIGKALRCKFIMIHALGIGANSVRPISKAG